MRNTYKYIIVDEGAILFPEAVVHIVVAHGFQEMKKRVYSAGFCTIDFLVKDNGLPKVTLTGKSVSLKIEQHLQDTVLICALFDPKNPIKYNLLIVKELYR